MYIYIRNIFWNILVICIYTIYIPSDTRPLSHLPRPCPRSDASHGPDPFPASQDAPGRKLNRGISRNVRFLYIFDSYFWTNVGVYICVYGIWFIWFWVSIWLIWFYICFLYAFCVVLYVSLFLNTVFGTVFT
jgi:hypothetical protein